MPSVTHIPGKPNLLLGAYDIASVGYSADEFFVSGTASSYATATAHRVRPTTPPGWWC